MNTTTPTLVIREEGDAFLFVESTMVTPSDEEIHMRHKISSGSVMELIRTASQWSKAMGFEEASWSPDDDPTMIVADLVPFETIDVELDIDMPDDYDDED